MGKASMTMSEHVKRNARVERECECPAQLWSGLSSAFQLLFWVSGFAWLCVAGEAGSPLPDNWRMVLLWSHVTEVSALLGLVASVTCAVVLWVRESKLSIAGISSVVLLILTGDFWWKLL
jgi:hypothetical protein